MLPMTAATTTPTNTLTITRPDDWHLHVRDGEALHTVVPHTAAQFGRAIIMPNLRPPVTTAELALADILRSRGSVAAEEYREDGVYYRGTVKIDDLHRFEEFLV